MKGFRKFLPFLVIVLASPILLGFSPPPSNEPTGISTVGYLDDANVECPDELVLRYARPPSGNEDFECGRISVIINHYQSINGCEEVVTAYLKNTLGAVSVSGWIHMDEVMENPLWNKNNFQQILDVRLDTGARSVSVRDGEVQLATTQESRAAVLNSVRRFNRSEKVLVAVPAYKFDAVKTWTPNDTHYVSHQQQIMERISMENAWALTRGNPSIRVGVMEPGFIDFHEDFFYVNSQGQWANRVLTGTSTDTDIYSVAHATGVAGIIGAVSDNNTGIAGIAQVQMMSLSHNAPRFYETITHAVDNNISIINASFVWTFRGGQSYYAVPTPPDATHVAALNRFGGLFVAGVPNGTLRGRPIVGYQWNWDNVGVSNDDAPFFPASYRLPNVISVGASQSMNDYRAVFSNFGAETVDIFAPGTDIMTTTVGNTYTTVSGTSFATPHVTGVAALMLSVNPYLTGAQIRNIIINTADQAPGLYGYSVSNGRLNAYAAVRGARRINERISEGKHVMDIEWGRVDISIHNNNTSLLAIFETAQGNVHYLTLDGRGDQTVVGGSWANFHGAHTLSAINVGRIIIESHRARFLPGPFITRSAYIQGGDSIVRATINITRAPNPLINLNTITGYRTSFGPPCPDLGPPPINERYILPSPTGLTVSANLIATWQPVPNALNYTVRIGNTERTVAGTSFNIAPLGLAPGTHSISVRANGSGFFWSSAFSPPVNFSVVAPPVPPAPPVLPAPLPPLGVPVVSVNSSLVASWAPITGAISYIIRIGNMEAEFAETFINLGQLNLAPGTYSISVRANGNGETNSNSIFSAAVPFLISLGADPGYKDVVLTATITNMQNMMFDELFREIWSELALAGYVPSIILQIGVRVTYEFYSTWGNGEINQGPDGLLTIPELGGVGQVFFNGNSTSNPFVHFGLINIFETNTFVCAFTNGLATIYGAVYIDIFYYYIWGELFIGGIIELLFPEFWGEGHFDIFWRLN